MGRATTGCYTRALSADGAKLVCRAGSELGIVDTGTAATAGDGEVDLDDVKIKVTKLEEFEQIFDEAWRIQRDWFYDPGMHGVDWAAVGDKYRRFVASCGNRSDLNYLIGEMIGELNIGHTYVYGGDVENLPSDVLAGRDPQLETAVRHLQQRLAEDPRELPPPPPYPDKSKPGEQAKTPPLQLPKATG